MDLKYANRELFNSIVFLLQEMCKQGYEMVPVNPATKEVEGNPCFARVRDIQPPVEGALVMTAAGDTEQVVRDCAEAGIHYVWVHRSGGPGAVSLGSVDFCHKRGIHLVEGHCPLMLLPTLHSSIGSTDSCLS